MTEKKSVDREGKESDSCVNNQSNSVSSPTKKEDDTIGEVHVIDARVVTPDEILKEMFTDDESVSLLEKIDEFDKFTWKLLGYIKKYCSHSVFTNMEKEYLSINFRSVVVVCLKELEKEHNKSVYEILEITNRLVDKKSRHKVAIACANILEADKRFFGEKK